MKILAKITIFLEIAFLVFTFFHKSSWFLPKRVLNFPETKNLIVYDNGLEYIATTKATTVGDFLSENKIQVSEGDEIFPSKNEKILPRMSVIINHQASIKILVDGQTKTATTFAKTVEDVLSEANVTLSHLDQIDPPKATRLRDNLQITVIRIKTEEVTEEEPINYPTVQKKDNTVDWGQKQTTQKGEKGIRETTYRINYEDGVQVSKIKLSSKITQEPVTEIVSIGTRIRVGKSNSGIASWYGTSDSTCSSRDFPAGTWLRVTNVGNGRQTFVKVEGYGPQAGTGKLIDLSKDAFKQLAPVGQGTTKVKVEEILNKNFNPILAPLH